MVKHLIFVYGSLLRGFGNWKWCLNGRSTFVGVGETQPHYTLLHLGGFPGLTLGGDGVVKGEVFEVTDPEVLADLDRLEGHPNFYIRTPITLADGQKVETYVLARKAPEGRYKVIESGDWRQERGVPVPKEAEA